MAIHSFGADWLTLTNILQDNQETEVLMSLFLVMSNIHTKWKSGGYKGKQDIGGKLKYGSRVRKDGRADEILVSSGRRADKTIDFVGDHIGYKATRLDIQVTMELAEPNPNMANDMYTELSLKKRMGSPSVGRRKLSQVRSETGDTLYIGTRKTGRKFYRLYDKSNDLGLERGLAWRVEIQYGRDMAGQALGMYIDIRGNQACVIDLVSAEFYNATGMNIIKGCSVDGEVISKSDEIEVTAQRKLDWLALCVKPTIAFLIDQDLEDEARKALGLRDGWQAKLEKAFEKVDYRKHYD